MSRNDEQITDLLRITRKLIGRSMALELALDTILAHAPAARQELLSLDPRKVADGLQASALSDEAIAEAEATLRALQGRHQFPR